MRSVRSATLLSPGPLPRVLGVSLLLAVAAAAFLAPGIAGAAEPSVIDTSPAGAGRSRWTYRDLHDAFDKYEGGYAGFDDPVLQLYTQSPHGGYNTTTNRCSMCHAVHRAEGSMGLTRADERSDACAYCHVGSAHSGLVVYDAVAGGMAPDVGHRIGVSTAIPLSTTYMDLTTATVEVVDADGATRTAEVPIRSVDTTPNAVFSLALRHGQSAAGTGRSGYERRGPVALTCMSCHQVHNAPAEIWQPLAYPSRTATLTQGYKLLRDAPAGSIQGPDDMPYDNGVPGFTVSYTRDGMRGRGAYTDFLTTGLVDNGNVVRVPEARLTSLTTGPGKTTWASPEPRTSAYWEASEAQSPAVDPAGVDQYALSAWCADCHNLTIGSFEERSLFETAGLAGHDTSMTHSVPMGGAGNGPGQCFGCHRANLSPTVDTSGSPYPGQDACESCHYGTASYARDPLRTAADFPHSAESSGYAMLGAWTVDASGAVQPSVVTSANATALVCRRCHGVADDPHGHRSATASDSISGTFDATYTAAPTETITFSGQLCGDCHLSDVSAEHAKASSAGDTSCARCHAASQPPDPWDGTCSGTGCHAAYHGDMNARHVQTPPTTCYGGGNPACHQKWESMDVAEAHADASRSWVATPAPASHPYVGGGSIPKDGCGLCHASALEVPAPISGCGDCHALPHP